MIVPKVGDIVQGRGEPSTIHKILKIHADGTYDVICIAGSALGRRRHITRPEYYVRMELSDADLWRGLAREYALRHDEEQFGKTCRCPACKRFRVLLAEIGGKGGKIEKRARSAR